MRRARLFILLACVFIQSCNQKKQPDLERLYSLSGYSTQEPTPLILIHGILGSKLRYKSSGKEIWPDNVRKLVFSKYNDLAFEIDSELLEPKQADQEAFHILDSIKGFGVYQEIIDTLVNYGNYQLTEVNQSYSKGRKLYIFNYDWRQDNVKSAQQLDKFIKQIQKQYPNKKNQKVDIVAHSMGGLIARYYMRYGTQDVLEDNQFITNLEGAKNIRKAVFLGTPNLGVVLSVNRLVNGYKFGLRTIPIEVMITMPSVYQMLPHSLTHWIVDLYGNIIELDVFDEKTWQKHQWAIYDPSVREKLTASEKSIQSAQEKLVTMEKYFSKNLERARRFLWSLTDNIENRAHDFIMMGGDCAKTPARLLMEKTDDKYFLKIFPSQVSNKKDGVDYEQVMLEPGDGHVTKSSLLARLNLDPSSPRSTSTYFPIKYKILLCESHRTLTSNIAFQNNLLDILLSAD